ncbi:putative ADP-heptose:LPS heptosyltransferase [Rhodospirillaceae bacterium LM-1]|nr:putative ADP-heptose:LPS heptosyltransferase [Rhodospirillaceae bacterium LM-1]
MITLRRLRALADPLAHKAGAARVKDKKPSGLLLIEAGGLGDVLLLACVIDAFRPLAQDRLTPSHSGDAELNVNPSSKQISRAGPGETIRLLLRRESAKTAFAMPPGIQVEIVDFYRLMKDWRYRFATLAQVRAWNVRSVVSLDWRRHPWMDDALLMAAAHGADFSAAFEPKPWPKFGDKLQRNAKRLSKLVAAPRPASMIERWLHLAQALTGQPPETPRLKLHDSHLSIPAEPLARPTILFSPFASSRDRQPLPDFWGVLAREFSDFDLKLLAGPGDVERNPDFKELANRLGVIERPFQALLPLFKAARLVIATDSATMHLASLTGVPTLSLSAAAYVGEVLPHALAFAPANLRVMVSDMPCQGCIGDCQLPFQGERYECVARLDVQDAIRQAREMLGLP